MKTTDYKSNTYFLIDKLFYLLVYSGLVAYLTYFLKDNNQIFIGGIIILSLLLAAFVRILTKFAKVNFSEDYILVNHLIFRKKVRIAYADIVEIHYIRGYKLSSLNVIKYLDNTTLRELKTTSVTTQEEFIDFVRWIKNKNNSIKFKFFPPNTDLEQKYNQEFN